VRDVQRLQRDLDSIMIGSTKLHVNKPRFDREEKHKKVQPSPSTRINTTEKTRPVWREVKRHQTYAQAVKTSQSNPTNKQQQWKGISFETEEANVKWLEGCYIGRVNNYIKTKTVMEEMMQGGLGQLSVKYMGDNAILIQGKDGTQLEKLIEENKEWWELNFESISQWNSAQILQHKIV